MPTTHNDTIERYISQKERDAVASEDFAGPDRTFPIRNQDDVKNAARLIGHAEHPDAVKAKIISIAKRKGLTLPASWQEDDKTEERMAGTIEQPSSFSFYAPFVRIDGEQKDKREVLGKATRGTPIDTYDTVVTYDASKRAFERAKRIPLREMHQAKAVGKGLTWWGIDKDEDIYLHSYISRGAEDTWTKVQEDILVGYSIKGEHAKYGTIERNGKTVTAIVDYDLVEVSLVDNPSCPGCDIAIMRADGIEQAVIASDEELAEVFQRDAEAENTPPPVAQPPEIERAGARISADTQNALHAARNSSIMSAKAMMDTCGCPACTAASKALDPDNDGDIDWMCLNDTDGDAESMPDDDTAIMERVAGAVDRAMAPVYQRMQAMLGQFSRAQHDSTAFAETIQRVAAMVETLPTTKSLDEVRIELSSVKDQVERIGKTPLPGGPHTGRTANGKTLATDAPAQQQAQAETPDVLRQLQQAGVQLNPAQSAQLVAASLKRTSIL